MDLTTPATFNEAVPAKRIRRLASAFSGSELEDALARIRRTVAHVTRVFDAEGNTTGVLFLEDIIEELVGEVQDATSASPITTRETSVQRRALLQQEPRPSAL
jgi:CBS domain containing-hemolysin-like protein